MVDLGGDYGGGGDQTTFGSPELPQGRTMQGAPYDTTQFKKKQTSHFKFIYFYILIFFTL